MRILLVDDQREVRTMLKIALRVNAGLDVVGEAASAARGAELAERLLPHAIVLDLMLPDAEPRDAFLLVRAAAPATRMVVYSAKESSRAWYEQQGARFFGKSTDPLELMVDWLRVEAGLAD